MRKFKHEWKRPTIIHGKPTRYGWTVLHPEKLFLGYQSDIGAYTLIQAEYGVIIDEDVQIGGGCKIYSMDTIDNTQGPVHIMRNASVGANSVVLPNSTIGENSIVGALSLVKGYIPANEVWGGVPAKKLRDLNPELRNLNEK